jgi:hypothetical protein
MPELDPGYLPWTRATDGTILSTASDAGRYCLRCNASIHASDPPHLCRDVARRLNDEIAATRDAMFAEYARELVVYGGEA